jgi:hypothetical protein
MGYHEFDLLKLPNIHHPLLLDICHLCITITHIFVFVNVSHMIFNHR